MTVLDLLKTSNYITFNKNIARTIGIDEAILLGYLCSFTDGDEDFHVDQEEICHNTCLTGYRLRNAMDKLVDFGILHVFRKGLPACNYYNIETEQLCRVINFSTTRSVKIATSCSSQEENEKKKKSSTKEIIKEKEEHIIKEKQTSLLKETVVEEGTTTTLANVENQAKRFKKPTAEEIQAYCDERGNGLNGQQIFDFYQAKGWVIGKSPMKDWKAAVRTWERNRKSIKKTFEGTPKTTLKRATISIDEALAIRSKYEAGDDDYE